MKCSLLAALFLLGATLTAEAETLVANSSFGAAILCSELDNFKIMLEHIHNGGKLPPVRGCWKVDNGGKVILLNSFNNLAYVAQDQGNISKGWTLLDWWRGTQ